MYLKSSDSKSHSCNDHGVLLYEPQQSVKTALDVLEVKCRVSCEYRTKKDCCILRPCKTLRQKKNVASYRAFCCICIACTHADGRIAACGGVKIPSVHVEKWGVIEICVVPVSTAFELKMEQHVNFRP